MPKHTMQKPRRKRTKRHNQIPNYKKSKLKYLKYAYPILINGLKSYPDSSYYYERSQAIVREVRGRGLNPSEFLPNYEEITRQPSATE